MFGTRFLRRLAISLMLVSILLLGIMATAAATVEHFFVSRIIAWREADFHDFEKFPSRPVPAGANEFSFKPAPERPPQSLRTVTYRRDAPDRPPRQSMATTLDSTGGKEVTEPLETFLSDTGTTAFSVIRDDTLLYEKYFNGYDHNSTQTSFSVAKSFVSALVGIAIEEGYIGSVEDPITKYIPELREEPGMERITIRHLLTMSSGLKYSGEGGGGGPFGDDAKTYYDPNPRELALTVEPEVEPGKRWEYNNYHPLLLGMILERATDRPVATYLSQKIWQPFGMEADASWSLDSKKDGFEKMESGINARAIDSATFGRLYLNRGEWNGKQVMPASWVEDSTQVDTTTDPADFYQYFWWVDVARPEPGRFMARGNYGQFIYVAPDKDLVIVRMGESFGYNRWPELLRSIADKVPS